MCADPPRKHVLIVDPDAVAVEPLRARLCDDGFTVSTASDCAAAAIATAESPPQLIIVDWNSCGYAAPDLIQRVRRLRATAAVRLIILSALAGEAEVVAGLELGADDYIVTPFSPREAAARVAAVLRARRPELRYKDLVLDAGTVRMAADGRPLRLRGAEYRLLKFLMSHPGRAFRRAQLLAQVWGDAAEIDEHTVDVNVHRLRKLLAGPGYAACIQTVRGFGYRFGAPPGLS